MNHLPPRSERQNCKRRYFQEIEVWDEVCKRVQYRIHWWFSNTMSSQYMFPAEELSNIIEWQMWKIREVNQRTPLLKMVVNTHSNQSNHGKWRTAIIWWNLSHLFELWSLESKPLLQKSTWTKRVANCSLSYWILWNHEWSISHFEAISLNLFRDSWVYDGQKLRDS
jgi:hypothetical protein